MKRRTDKTLGEQDRRLLALLQEDARMPTAALARALGVARTTIVERLKRLHRDGIVSGYTVRMHPKAHARMLRVHVLLSADSKQAKAIVAALHALPQVRAAYAISGAFDFLAFVEGETTDEIDQVLDAIGAIRGVKATQSSLVLSVKFDRQ